MYTRYTTNAYSDCGALLCQATLTSTDLALADYIFGVIQGCVTEVACVGADAAVQWHASLLAGPIDRRTMR